MRRLQDVLEQEYGLDITGWRVGGATGITPDGRTMVGWGVNPNGNTEAWLARIPEPDTLLLTIVGALALRATRDAQRGERRATFDRRTG